MVKQKLNKILNIVPVYLLLVSIFPVLSLYAHNITQVAITSIIRSVIISLVVPAIVFGFLYWITKKLYFSALTVAFALLLFYLVIPLQTTLLPIEAIKPINRLRYLFPFITLIFLIGIWGGFKKIHNPKSTTIFVNVIAMTMLLFPASQITQYWIQQILVRNSAVQHDTNDIVAVNQENVEYQPDIYLIVLDAHGRSDAILDAMGYDNSLFIRQLEDLGFYVAKCSNANYPSATWQSMAATLNMRYFDHEQWKNQNPLLTHQEGQYLIRSNLVTKKLRERGYKFVNFNTGWGFLNFPDADVFYNFEKYKAKGIGLFNKFEYELINKTPLTIFTEYLIPNDEVHYNNIVSNLQELPRLPQVISSPKFIYAHLMIPHDPYVFSSTGEFTPSANSSEFDIEKYTNQLIYIENEMITILKTILADSSEQPIIILQGDHGFPSNEKNHASGILNAYFLPGDNKTKFLYPSISPINSFRMIFDLYLDEEFDLLPDYVYFDNLGSDLEHKARSIPYQFMYYEPNTCQ